LNKKITVEDKNLKNIAGKVNFEKPDPICGYSGKSRVLHWICLITCIFLHIMLNMLIIRMSKYNTANIVTINNIRINRYSLIGVIAQFQVINVILITLNPLKRSNLVAIFLCIVTGTASFTNVLCSNLMEALPGVFISITSITVVIIISGYGKSLNNQIRKVLEYSKIVKKDDEMLHRLAYYDTLTGLPNRKMMRDQMDLLTDPLQQEKSSFIFVYLDLDNFKKINDFMGHSIGDYVLKQVTKRWSMKRHEDDLLGRIGGDEFALLIQRSIGSEELILYLDSLRTALKEPILTGRKEFYITASFGVTKYPQDGKSTDELFKNADIALYKVKNNGKNDYRFFSKEMQEEVLNRIRLENELQSAISNNELYMVFQPQYECASRTLRAYEALVRWNNPEIGMVSPSVFIPIAEEMGTIIEIGKWILEYTLTKFMELKSKNNINAVVAINISVVQMTDPSFLYIIKEVLKYTGFDCRYLELEITESIFITYPDTVIEVIRQLKKMGIRIALDDFGTGYASLNYLQILPINILKIDKTFIDKIKAENAPNQIVGTIISLSHELGIEVVAEGVEREEQLKYLINHNCDYVQGFLHSKPLTQEQIIRMNNYDKVS
jgi:diguanylate cyclase (GGDEF)-like protein